MIRLIIMLIMLIGYAMKLEKVTKSVLTKMVF